MPPPAPPPAPASDPAPRAPSLGLLDTTLLVMGSIIGVGVFFTPGSVARLVPDGPLLLLLWALGAAIALCGAATFAELGLNRPVTGGWFSYLSQAFGPRVAFLFAWTILAVVSTASIAVIADFCAQRLAGLAGGAGPGLQVAVAALLLLGATALCQLGVRTGATFQNLCMALKLLAIAALVLAGLLLAKPALLTAPPADQTTPTASHFSAESGGAESDPGRPLSESQASGAAGDRAPDPTVAPNTPPNTPPSPSATKSGNASGTTPANASASTPESKPASTPANAQASTPGNTPASTPSNESPSTPASAPASTLANESESTPESTPDSTPESTPESAPEGTPEGTPASTPASTPQSTPASSPENTPKRPAPPSPARPWPFAAALLPILFTYGGWQNVCYIAESVKDPRRNLPRGILLGILGVALVYLAINAAYLRAFGAAGLADEPRFAVRLASAAFGPAGETLVEAAMAISALGILVVTVLVTPSIYVALANRGLWFPAFARLHPRTAAPTAGLWTQFALALTYLLWARALPLSPRLAPFAIDLDALVGSIAFAEWLFHGLAALALLRWRRTPAHQRLPHLRFAPHLYLATALTVVLSNLYTNQGPQILLGLAALALGLLAHRLLPFRPPATPSTPPA